MAFMNVRLSARYGRQPDIAACPKSAMNGNQSSATSLIQIKYISVVRAQVESTN
jgi:hypothetical protein